MSETNSTSVIESDVGRYESVSLDFPRLHQYERSKGTIKAQAEDFYVEEIMQPSLSGEGEHVWLWIEKQNQNTEYLAKQIARYAGVRAMDVGFSGLKDRWAVTRQWFSVYLGNRTEPEWSKHEIEGLTILKQARHSKKLRRGEHSANRFRIVIRQFEETPSVEEALSSIQRHGFPNYFGPQRFGRNASNLSRAARWFSGAIKVSRSQRSFYLSATRSYLFNLNLAKAIETEKRPEDLLRRSGPLYGDPQAGVENLNECEERILSEHPLLAKGIHSNRMKLERRDYLVVPETMTWSTENSQLVLDFILPVGVFATTLLSEFCDYTDAQEIVER